MGVRFFHLTRERQAVFQPLLQLPSRPPGRSTAPPVPSAVGPFAFFSLAGVMSRRRFNSYILDH